VAAFVRIGWPLSIGIGGRFASDSAFYVADYGLSAFMDVDVLYDTDRSLFG